MLSKTAFFVKNIDRSVFVVDADGVVAFCGVFFGKYRLGIYSNTFANLNEERNSLSERLPYHKRREYNTAIETIASSFYFSHRAF